MDTEVYGKILEEVWPSKPEGRTYYEAHITIEADRFAVPIREAVESLRWKFSAIDGDPVMGDGVKCYATRHYNSRRSIESALNKLHDAADYLVGAGFNVTRRKIELVLFDDRSSKVKPCDGNCAECHTDDLPVLGYTREEVEGGLMITTPEGEKIKVHGAGSMKGVDLIDETEFDLTKPIYEQWLEREKNG